MQTVQPQLLGDHSSSPPRPICQFSARVVLTGACMRSPRYLRLTSPSYLRSSGRCVFPSAVEMWSPDVVLLLPLLPCKLLSNLQGCVFPPNPQIPVLGHFEHYNGHRVVPMPISGPRVGLVCPCSLCNQTTSLASPKLFSKVEKSQRLWAARAPAGPRRTTQNPAETSTLQIVAVREMHAVKNVRLTNVVRHSSGVGRGTTRRVANSGLVVANSCGHIGRFGPRLHTFLLNDNLHSAEHPTVNTQLEGVCPGPPTWPSLCIRALSVGPQAYRTGNGCRPRVVLGPPPLTVPLSGVGSVIGGHVWAPSSIRMDLRCRWGSLGQDGP